MSRLIKKIFFVATTILFVCLINSLSFSKDLQINIKVVSSPNPQIFITGNFSTNTNLIDKHWSFLQSHADAENLASRISNFELTDENGDNISYKQFAKGEFVAKRKASNFSYVLDAKPLANVSANAHVSWLGKTHGLLMLNDLLPRLKGKNNSLKIIFSVPKKWKIAGDFQNKEISRKNSSANLDDLHRQVFSFTNINLSDLIFLVGKNWREKEILVNKTRLNFLILNEWQFDDELAYKMAKEITGEYANLFGDIPVKNAQIVLMDFPKKTARGRWRAETRGANITILSSQSFAASFAEQRLHEQLRHEVFHLWIPNSLNLSGDYAWFYEGFAIYQALKTGVKLGQIRFEDYLNTLEQAYFLNQKRTRNNSLINLSKMRWNGEVSSVYAKGILVAFLCDSVILAKSKGKGDVKKLFRELYKKHRNNSETKDANLSILSLLEKRAELTEIINLYIKGTKRIDWSKQIKILGIENIGGKIKTKLKVKSKLSRRQKTLLKKLGYNR